MSHDERGFYILALCVQWSKGGISKDEFARLGRGLVEPSLNHVLTKFETGEDGFLRNRRLEEERAKQTAYRTKQSEKGLASAKARFNHGSTTVQPNGEPEGNSPSPSPSPIERKKAKSGFEKPTLDEIRLLASKSGLPHDSAVIPHLHAVIPQAADEERNGTERKGSAPPSSEHVAFVDGWMQNFKAQFGFDYLFDGARDGRAVKELLRMQILRIDLLEIAKKAWSRAAQPPKAFNCEQASTIHGFKQYFNQLQVELKNGTRQRNNSQGVDRNANTANAGKNDQYANVGKVRS